MTTPREHHPTERGQPSDKDARQNKTLELSSDPLRSEKALDVHGIQKFMDRSPFMAWMGFRVTAADPTAGTIEVHIPMRPEFERGPGTNQWHGGVMSAVVDTVGDFALVMAIGKPLPTINLRIDYLRPAIDTGLRVIATVRRQGKTVGVADVDIFNDNGILLAIGRAAYATA